MRKLTPKIYARTLMAAMEGAPSSERAGILDRFVALIAKHRDMRRIPSILDAVEGEIAEREGRVSASVISAKPLGHETKTILERTLHGAIGKNITIQESHDASVVGGARIRVGDLLIDGTIRAKLDRLTKSF